MRFFLDNCLSPRQAQALHALSDIEGHDVAHLRDRFPPATPDEEWLAALSHDGPWVVISGDMRIFKLPQLREVWRQAKLTTFFLKKGWMHQPFWDQTWWLVRWWPKLMQAADLVEQGTGFVVPAKPTGKLERL